MRLVNLNGDWVSKVGETLKCIDTYGEELTLYQNYKIIAHHMDEEAWDKQQYYTVEDNDGTNVRVPMFCFNDPDDD